MTRNILVVDDDPVIRLLTEQILSAAGHQVQAVSSGAECLEVLRSTPPELVLLDVMMPGMSGVDVLREIRQSPEIAAIPVIMLSASMTSEKILEEDQPNGYVEKPFKSEQLLSEIERVLGSDAN